MEDDLDKGKQNEEGHEIPEEIEIGRNSSSIIFEILDDVPTWPFAVFKFLKALAAVATITIGIIDSRFGAIIVEIGERKIGRPFERVILRIH